MTEQPGRLRPTRLRTLLWTAAAGVVVGWFGVPLVRQVAGAVPTIPWTSVLALVFAAAALGGIAGQTWHQLQRKRRWIDPNRAVNFLVLAKASVLVGAAVAGVYAGYGLQYVDALGYDAPTQRVIRAGVAVVAGVLIVVAGLLLERACIVPGLGKGEEEEEEQAESDESDETGGGESDRHARLAGWLRSRTGSGGAPSPTRHVCNIA